MCRRIGHAGLAGAIFEYGRKLGTGDWNLGHLKAHHLAAESQKSAFAWGVGPMRRTRLSRHLREQSKTRSMIVNYASQVSP
jgi:hypothetical protein